MSKGSVKPLLASVVALFASAPMMDHGNETTALAGLLLGLAGVAGIALVAWQQL